MSEPNQPEERASIGECRNGFVNLSARIERDPIKVPDLWIENQEEKG